MSYYARDVFENTICKACGSGKRDHLEFSCGVKQNDGSVCKKPVVYVERYSAKNKPKGARPGWKCCAVCDVHRARSKIFS